VHTIAEDGGRRSRRRRHSDEFKAKVVAACRRPGVSIASVALAHGLNANLLRRWIVEREHRSAPGLPALASPPVSGSPQSFVPLALSKAPTRAGDIHVELWRHELKVSVTWPAASAAECAAWLRELMR
jgi:transposase